MKGEDILILNWMSVDIPTGFWMVFTTVSSAFLCSEHVTLKFVAVTVLVTLMNN